MWTIRLGETLTFTSELGRVIISSKTLEDSARGLSYSMIFEDSQEKVIEFRTTRGLFVSNSLPGWHHRTIRPGDEFISCQVPCYDKEDKPREESVTIQTRHEQIWLRVDIVGSLVQVRNISTSNTTVF